MNNTLGFNQHISKIAQNFLAKPSPGSEFIQDLISAGYSPEEASKIYDAVFGLSAGGFSDEIVSAFKRLAMESKRSAIALKGIIPAFVGTGINWRGILCRKSGKFRKFKI